MPMRYVEFRDPGETNLIVYKAYVAMHMPLPRTGIQTRYPRIR